MNDLLNKLTTLQPQELFLLLSGIVILTVLVISLITSLFSSSSSSTEVNVASDNKEQQNHNRQSELNKIAEKLQLVVEEKVREDVNRRDLDGSVLTEKVDKVVKHYPEWNFTEKFVEIKTDPSIKTYSINSTIRALSAELSRMGLIKSPCLINDPTGYPGFYRLKVVTEDELKLSDLLDQAGLIIKNSIGETVVPDFRIDDERNIYIDASKLPIKKPAIAAALPFFDTLNDNAKYSPSNITLSNSIFKIKATKRKDLLTVDGRKLTEVYDEYIKEVSSVPPDSWILGQDAESGEVITLPVLEKPALFIAGTSGSGKSVMSKSVVYSRLINNPNLEVYFFDGKGAAEWSEFADRTSSLQLTKPRQKEYPLNAMVEFSNLVDIIWNEYLRRQQLLEKSNTSNFVEHNKKCASEDKINPMLVIFEETPVIFSFIDFNGESNVVNSASWKMLRLAREMRSYGFNWMLISQTVTQESVPPDLSKQALYVVGKSNAATANYMKCQEITDLEREFIVRADGLNRKAKAFYMGDDDDIRELLDKAGFDKTKPKKKINYDLVNYTGNENTKNELHFLAKSTLFGKYQKEMWIDNAETVDCAGVVTNQLNEKLAIYHLAKDELVATHLLRIAVKDVNYHVYILGWELKENDIDKLEQRKQDGEFPDGSVFLSSTRFKKLLARSFEQGDKEDVFETAILSIERQSKVDAKEGQEHDKKMDKLISKSGSSTTGWSYDELVPQSKTTPQEARRLEALKANTKNQQAKKGMLFEALLCKYFEEEKEKYDIRKVYAADKLKKSEIITTLKEKGDGGIDLVLEHNDDSFSLIQAKCHADSNPVKVEVVDKTSIARQYLEYHGYKLKRLAIYTTSRFTGDAEAKAEIFGVELINGSELERLLSIHQNELAAAGLKAKPGRPKKFKVAA